MRPGQPFSSAPETPRIPRTAVLIDPSPGLLSTSVGESGAYRSSPNPPLGNLGMRGIEKRGNHHGVVLLEC